MGSDQDTGRPVNPTEQAIRMFEKLAVELGSYERSWEAYIPGYGEGHDHGRARALGMREAVVAIKDVANNARRDTAASVAEAEAGAASLRQALQQVKEKTDDIYIFELADKALSSTTAGKALLDRIAVLEKQNEGLRSFLGTLAHEMETFCTVNIRGDKPGAIDAAVAMMGRWCALIDAACEPSDTPIKEAGTGGEPPSP